MFRLNGILTETTPANQYLISYFDCCSANIHIKDKHGMTMCLVANTEPISKCRTAKHKICPHSKRNQVVQCKSCSLFVNINIFPFRDSNIMKINSDYINSIALIKKTFLCIVITIHNHKCINHYIFYLFIAKQKSSKQCKLII